MCARAAGKRFKPPRAIGASLFGGVEQGGDGAAAPPPPGLSLVHTDTLAVTPDVGSFVIRVPLNGAVVRITRVAGPRGRGQEDDSAPPKRGGIQGLSGGAALRLRRSMLSVDASKVVQAFFVGNTVPIGEFGWPDFRVFLRRYRSRFERRWPGVPAYWVKELQGNGTPHLHLVVLWVSAPPTLQKFRNWNDEAWAKVVRSTHPKHREVGCSVDLVRSYQGSAAYLSGYLTQPKKIVRDDGTEEVIRQSDTGKMWGCINKAHLPITWESDTLAPAQGLQLTRIMRRWRERKGTFFLHSKSSHDSPRTMGKPTEWRRVRAAPSAAVGVPELIEFYRGLGARVRRCRPRLFRRNGVKLWDMDEGSRKVERRNVEPKKLYLRDPLNGKVLKDSAGEKQFEWVDEIHSVCSGWHFIDVAHFGKLVRFVKGTGAAVSLTSCEKRWLKNGDI